MYKVTRNFADLADGCHVYRAGDTYPRSGKADPKRAAELSSRGNKLGVPLIVWEDAPVEDKPKQPRKKAATNKT